MGFKNEWTVKIDKLMAVISQLEVILQKREGRIKELKYKLKEKDEMIVSLMGDIEDSEKEKLRSNNNTQIERLSKE